MANIYKVLILSLALIVASRAIALEVQEYKELKEKSIESKEILQSISMVLGTAIRGVIRY